MVPARQHAGCNVQAGEIAPTAVELVLSSGVAEYATDGQIETKKNPQAARNISSVLSRAEQRGHAVHGTQDGSAGRRALRLGSPQ